jgi:hypothetical protein
MREWPKRDCGWELLDSHSFSGISTAEARTRTGLWVGSFSSISTAEARTRADAAKSSRSWQESRRPTCRRGYGWAPGGPADRCDRGAPDARTNSERPMPFRPTLACSRSAAAVLGLNGVSRLRPRLTSEYPGLRQQEHAGPRARDLGRRRSKALRMRSTRSTDPTFFTRPGS